jgi:hypothetical protein
MSCGSSSTWRQAHLAQLTGADPLVVEPRDEPLAGVGVRLGVYDRVDVLHQAVAGAIELVLGQAAGEELLGQRGEVVAVRVGDAEKLADYAARDPQAEMLDQIDGRAVCKHLVDDLVHGGLQLRNHRLDALEGELARDHPPVRHVLGAVEEHHRSLARVLARPAVTTDAGEPRVVSVGADVLALQRLPRVG